MIFYVNIILCANIIITFLYNYKYLHYYSHMEALSRANLKGTEHTHAKKKLYLLFVKGEIYVHMCVYCLYFYCYHIIHNKYLQKYEYERYLFRTAVSI